MRSAMVFLLALAAGVGAGPIARVEGPGVELELSLDKGVYARGEPVQMELVVRNRGPASVTFQFRDSQRYDFLVAREGGRVVWYWSYDKVFAQVLGSLTLGPGEERRYRARWEQHDMEGRLVPPGRYWVEGVFPPRRPVHAPTPGVGPRVAVQIGSFQVVSPAYRKVFRPGRVRVRFFAWASEQQVRRLLDSLELQVEHTDPAGFVVARLRGGEEVWKVARALNQSPLVEWAVPDYLLVSRR